MVSASARTTYCLILLCCTSSLSQGADEEQLNPPGSENQTSQSESLQHQENLEAWKSMALDRFDGEKLRQAWETSVSFHRAIKWGPSWSDVIADWNEYLHLHPGLELPSVE